MLCSLKRKVEWWMSRGDGKKGKRKKYAAIVVPATAMISVILYYECITKYFNSDKE